MKVPLTCVWDVERGAGLLLPPILDGDAGSPGGFGDEEQGVDMRRDADGVPVDLVESPASVLGLGATVGRGGLGLSGWRQLQVSAEFRCESVGGCGEIRLRVGLEVAGEEGPAVQEPF